MQSQNDKQNTETEPSSTSQASDKPIAKVTSLRIVERAVIEVEITVSDGYKLRKRHDLDKDLGNEGGTFTFIQNNFSYSARNIRLKNRTLSAELCSYYETWHHDMVGIEIDIPSSLKASDISIRVVEYEPRHDPSSPDARSRLIQSTREDIQNLRLISDSVLAGDCLQPSGRYATSYVDLDGLIGNTNGTFQRGGSGYFYSGNEFRLDGTTLHAQLWDLYDTPQKAAIDIGRLVRVSHGRLVPFSLEDPLDAPPAVPVEDADADGTDEPLIGCRTVHLHGKTLLIAKTVLRGGRLQESAFRLNELFGVANGDIRPFSRDYHLSDAVVEDSIELQENVLFMDIKSRRNGSCEQTVETCSVNLKEFIEAKNGKLSLIKGAPCEGCSELFRCERLYIPTTERFRTRLDNFDLTSIDPDCGLCKIISSLVKNSVPFVRSCEIWVETWTERLEDKHEESIVCNVEIETVVNGVKRSYRLFVDTEDVPESDAFELVPFKHHSDEWLDPSQRWPMILRAIEDCQNTHVVCRGSDSALMPSRVLDLGTSPDDSIRLNTSPDPKRKYACLSHCWGKTRICQLTTQTLEEYSVNIPINMLSRTYNDAIDVCRRLGITYLWIDSLCIVQDSKEDWLTESAKMGRYYGSCYVTIAATNSALQPQAGLEIVERSRASRADGVDEYNLPYGLIAFPSTLVEPLPHFSQADPSTIQQHFPLMTRAWTLQERWLSPRTIHFCGKEVVFECAECLRCECGHAEDEYLFEIGHDAGRIMPIENMHDGIVLRRKAQEERRWTSFISAYSTLNLTFATDRLPAISGLAREFSNQAKKPLGRYLAGLWEHHLHDELAWFVGEPLLRYRDNPDFQRGGHIIAPVAQHTRSKNYIAPSWSWASVFDPVNYRIPQSRTYHFTILNVQVDLEGQDQYGAVTKTSHLKVQAKLIPTSWYTVEVDDTQKFILSDIVGTQRIDRWEARGIDFLPDYATPTGDQSQLRESEMLFVMPILSESVSISSWSEEGLIDDEPEREIAFAKELRNTLCMVLRKSQDPQDGADVYERVGFTEYVSVTPETKNRDMNRYVEETLIIQ